MPAVVTRNIQSPLLWSWSGIFATRYGAVTLYRTPFQEISPVLKIRCDQSEHHISLRIRFGLCRVHSRLVTTSLLLFVPAPTEMFQFGAFPIARSNCGGDSHSEIPSS